MKSIVQMLDLASGMKNFFLSMKSYIAALVGRYWLKSSLFIFNGRLIL